MTYDTLGGGGKGWTLSKNVRSLVLTVWERQCYEDIFKNFELTRAWLNHKAFCKTAFFVKLYLDFLALVLLSASFRDLVSPVCGIFQQMSLKRWWNRRPYPTFSVLVHCQSCPCRWDVARYFPRCSLCMAEVPLASGQDHGVALTLHFLQYHQVLVFFDNRPSNQVSNHGYPRCK